MFAPEWRSHFPADPYAHVKFSALPDFSNNELNYVLASGDPDSDIKYMRRVCLIFAFFAFTPPLLAGNPLVMEAVQASWENTQSQLLTYAVLATVIAVVYSSLFTGRGWKAIFILGAIVFSAPWLWYTTVTVLGFALQYALVAMLLALTAGVAALWVLRRMVNNYATLVSAHAYSAGVEAGLSTGEKNRAIMTFAIPIVAMTLLPGKMALAVPLVLLAIVVLQKIRSGFKFAEDREAVMQLAHSWLTYGRGARPMPGVFLGAFRSQKLRLGMMAFLFFLMGCALTPAAAKFARGGPEFHGAGEALMTGVIEAVFIFLPVGVLLLYVTLIVAGRSLLTTARNFAEAENMAVVMKSEKPLWEVYANRILNTKDKMEKQHLFAGFQATAGFPVYLHKKILQDHGYIVGDTGSGKTALGNIPLIQQLIRFRESAVVILDLKGDPAMLQTARYEAKQKNTPFRLFTLGVGEKTNIFNPFQQEHIQDMTVAQQAEILLESLQLNHGSGYGRSYYSRRARAWLTGTLAKFGDEITSFKDLYEKTKLEGAFPDVRDRQDTYELIAVCQSLSELEQLNMGPRHQVGEEVLEHQIHMGRVLEEKEVVYFWLPAVIGAAGVVEVAKLALYALITAGYERQQKKLEHRSAHVMFDEFQRAASENLKLILQQARSLGVHMVLSNQTMADLQTADTDLRPTVLTNTRWKLCFSASDLEQQDYFIKASGEAIRQRESLTASQQGASETQSEMVETRLMRNDLIEMSDELRAALLQVTRGEGYTQFSGYPLMLGTYFSLSQEQHDKRQEAPWPQDVPGTFEVTKAPWETAAREEVGELL